MCGRFTRNYTWRQVHDFLDLHFPQFEDPGPSFNVAPTQTVPICAWHGERSLEPMKWGLVPFWAKDRPGGFINARAETASTKPAFRSAWKKRRCLLPASGFYEWKKTDTGKQPFHISLLNDPIFCMASLWEEPIEEGELPTFTILTVAANELVAEVHDRMPALLRPSQFDEWLAGEPPEPMLLGPFAAEEMQAVAVSSRVNSPRNNAPDLLEPEAGLF